MPTTRQDEPDTRLIAALDHAVPSTRLRAALAAGTTPHPTLVEPLVDRCRTESDFFVRDMLTWALTRHPASLTVPALLDELDSPHPQARNQALHTLSKIADPATWPAVRAALVHDPDDEVVRAAWRAAVVLVPRGHEHALATELASALGRGDRDTQLSLSRALVALGDGVPAVLEHAKASGDPRVRAHAAATEQLLHDPDGEFAAARDEATRIVLTGAAPTVDPAC